MEGASGGQTCDDRRMPLVNESVDVLGIALVALHIAFAAVWFGHKLALPSDMRAAIHAMEGPETGLVGRLRRSVALDWVAAVGVLATGVLLAYRQGFGEVKVSVWAGATAALGLVAVAIMVTGPARRDLRAALAAGQRPEATAAGKRVAGAINIEGLLWLVALVLMLV